MKKEARVLFGKSLDSLFLAIEHFNRPWDRGRAEAVLILLDRSFELLLKAVIIHRGGKIREHRAKETLGFDSCVRKCFSDADVKCLDEEETVTVQVINSLRDAAQHYLLEISEQQLYIYTQGGLTLYDTLIQRVLGESLRDHFPQRVLPISTEPPQDLVTVINAEFDDIKALLAPRARKRLDAISRLRGIQIVEESLGGSRSQPSEQDLKRLVEKIRAGMPWQDLFPGVASLQLDTTGTGLSVSLKITKNEGEPVYLVKEGTPGATVVAIKRVNELGYYTLGLNDLAGKLGISTMRTLAVIRGLKIQQSIDYFKEFRIGNTLHKRYSDKCLTHLKEQIPHLDMDTIWQKYQPKKKASPKFKR